jgi:hypothetical protein
VEKVTWDDVQEFIERLNRKEERDRYRLPTEAEWEYAARAGSQKRYPYSDGSGGLALYAWYNGNSDGKESSAHIQEGNENADGEPNVYASVIRPAENSSLATFDLSNMEDTLEEEDSPSFGIILSRYLQ